MVCAITCSIAIAFLVANLYVTFTVDKTKMMTEFNSLMSDPLKQRYQRIVNERRDIYLQGYALGLLISFVIIALQLRQYVRLGTLSLMCTVGAITFLVNYFYYMLTPKSDYMVIHLNEPRQRAAWQKISRTMQVKYHLGLLFGILAAVIFTKAFCQ